MGTSASLEGALRGLACKFIPVSLGTNGRLGREFYFSDHNSRCCRKVFLVIFLYYYIVLCLHTFSLIQSLLSSTEILIMTLIFPA